MRYPNGLVCEGLRLSLGPLQALGYTFQNKVIMNSVVDRFNQKLLITPGCWLWKARQKKGYGLMYVQGKMVAAHRLSYELHVGKIPDGLLVCHKCDNPICVNPEHLFVGSDADNSDDKLSKGRQAKGPQVGTAKLSEMAVLEMRQMYAKGKNGGIKALASRFNISKSQVWNVVNRKEWQHLD